MKIIKSILRWVPAIAVMTVIYGFSSIPAREMPSFGIFDLVVKKGGHVLGYGLLALAIWYGMNFEKRSWRLVLLLAIVYAVTDEFHQSFIPGRHPSWVDALVIDGGGAAVMIWVVSKVRKKCDREHI